MLKRDCPKIVAKDLLDLDVPDSLVEVVFENLFKSFNALRLCDSEKTEMSKSDPILSLFKDVYYYFRMNFHARCLSLTTQETFDHVSTWNGNPVSIKGRLDIAFSKATEDLLLPFLVVECKAQSVDQAINQLTSYLIYARDSWIKEKITQVVF